MGPSPSEPHGAPAVGRRASARRARSVEARLARASSSWIRPAFRLRSAIWSPFPREPPAMRITSGATTPSQPNPPIIIIASATIPARMNPTPRTNDAPDEPGSTRSASFSASSLVGGETSTGPPARAVTTACSSSRIRAFAASLACASSAAADTAVSAAVAASPATSTSCRAPDRLPALARSCALWTRPAARSARRAARSARSRALRTSRVSSGSMTASRPLDRRAGGGGARRSRGYGAPAGRVVRVNGAKAPRRLSGAPRSRRWQRRLCWIHDSSRRRVAPRMAPRSGSRS